MAKVFSHGLIKDNTKETTMKTRRKDMESLLGEMVADTMVLGSMASKKARVFILMHTVSSSVVCGRKERGLSGCDQLLTHLNKLSENIYFQPYKISFL